MGGENNKMDLTVGGASMSTTNNSDAARIAQEIGNESSPVPTVFRKQLSIEKPKPKRSPILSPVKAKLRDSDPALLQQQEPVSQPEPEPESDEKVPLSVWQIVLKKYNDPVKAAQAKFTGLMDVIQSRNEELTERLRQNYNSRKLSSNLSKLDKLGSNKGKRYERIREELKSTIEDYGIICEVSGEQDLNHTYRLQGNLEMYNTDNQTRRKNNKTNKLILSKLEIWWAKLPKCSNTDIIDKDIYSWLSSKLFRTFVPNASEGECEMCIEEDWKTDSKGMSTMSTDLFNDAMFQFADIWCETSDHREYADFLEACMRISIQGEPFKRTIPEPTKQPSPKHTSNDYNENIQSDNNNNNNNNNKNNNIIIEDDDDDDEDGQHRRWRKPRKKSDGEKRKSVAGSKSNKKQISNTSNDNYGTIPPSISKDEVDRTDEPNMSPSQRGNPRKPQSQKSAAKRRVSVNKSNPSGNIGHDNSHPTPPSSGLAPNQQSRPHGADRGNSPNQQAHKHRKDGGGNGGHQSIAVASQQHTTGEGESINTASNPCEGEAILNAEPNNTSNIAGNGGRSNIADNSEQRDTAGNGGRSNTADNCEGTSDNGGRGNSNTADNGGRSNTADNREGTADNSGRGNSNTAGNGGQGNIGNTALIREQDDTAGNGGRSNTADKGDTADNREQGDTSGNGGRGNIEDESAARRLKDKRNPNTLNRHSSDDTPEGSNQRQRDIKNTELNSREGNTDNNEGTRAGRTNEITTASKKPSTAHIDPSKDRVVGDSGKKISSNNTTEESKHNTEGNRVNMVSTGDKNYNTKRSNADTNREGIKKSNVDRNKETTGQHSDSNSRKSSGETRTGPGLSNNRSDPTSHQNPTERDVRKSKNSGNEYSTPKQSPRDREGTSKGSRTSNSRGGSATAEGGGTKHSNSDQESKGRNSRTHNQRSSAGSVGSTQRDKTRDDQSDGNSTSNQQGKSTNESTPTWASTSDRDRRQSTKNKQKGKSTTNEQNELPGLKAARNQPTSRRRSEIGKHRKSLRDENLELEPVRGSSSGNTSNNKSKHEQQYITSTRSANIAKRNQSIVETPIKKYDPKVPHKPDNLPAVENSKQRQQHSDNTAADLSEIPSLGDDSESIADHDRRRQKLLIDAIEKTEDFEREEERRHITINYNSRIEELQQEKEEIEIQLSEEEDDEEISALTMMINEIDNEIAEEEENKTKDLLAAGQREKEALARKLKRNEKELTEEDDALKELQRQVDSTPHGAGAWDQTTGSEIPVSPDSDLLSVIEDEFDASVARRRQRISRRKQVDANALKAIKKTGQRRRHKGQHIISRLKRKRDQAQKDGNIRDVEDLQGQITDEEQALEEDIEIHEHTARDIERKMEDLQDRLQDDLQTDIQRARHRAEETHYDKEDGNQTKTTLKVPIDSGDDKYGTTEWHNAIKKLQKSRERKDKKHHRTIRQLDDEEDRSHAREERYLNRLHTKRKRDLESQRELLEKAYKRTPNSNIKSKIDETSAAERDYEHQREQQLSELRNRRQAELDYRKTRNERLQTESSERDKEINKLFAARNRRDVDEASNSRIELEQEEVDRIRKVFKQSTERRTSSINAKDSQYDSFHRKQHGGGWSHPTDRKSSNINHHDPTADPYNPKQTQLGNGWGSMKFGAIRAQYFSDWDGLPVYKDAKTGIQHIALSEQRGDRAWELCQEELQRERERKAADRMKYLNIFEKGQLEREAQWREWLRQQRLDNIKREKERLQRLRDLAAKQEEWRRQLERRLAAKQLREDLERRKLAAAIKENENRVLSFLRAKHKAAENHRLQKILEWEQRELARHERMRDQQIQKVKERQEASRNRIQRQRQVRDGSRTASLSHHSHDEEMRLRREKTTKILQMRTQRQSQNRRVLELLKERMDQLDSTADMEAAEKLKAQIQCVEEDIRSSDRDQLLLISQQRNKYINLTPAKFETNRKLSTPGRGQTADNGMDGWTPFTIKSYCSSSTVAPIPKTTQMMGSHIWDDEEEASLANTATRLESEEFTVRKTEYESRNVSLRDIYLLECSRYRQRPNSLFSKTSCNVPGDYSIELLDLSTNYIASLKPFLDVIRMASRLRKISLRDNGLSNEDIKILCESIQDHPSIEEIDLTGNKRLTVVAGRYLQSLIKCRERLCYVRVQNTSIPLHISRQLMNNSNSIKTTTVSRDPVPEVVDDIDADGCYLPPISSRKTTVLK